MWFKVLKLLKLNSSSLGLYWFELKFMCWYYNIFVRLFIFIVLNYVI